MGHFTGCTFRMRKIVKVDINQPWKMCYEEGLKWLKTRETTPIKAKQAEKARRSYVYYCVPSDDPWFVLYKLAKPFFFTAFQVELAAM